MSVEYIHQTDRAVLITDGDDEHWLPKSIIINWLDDYSDQELTNGEVIHLVIPEWVVEERGLA